MNESNPQTPWSHTARDLREHMRDCLRSDETAVVATVVDVEGSAYRRPGAKMVVTPGKRSVGAVTAGCLEGPIAELAADVVASGTPRLETFDLMDDDTWGLGLGCNGIIDVLFEPLDDRWATTLDALAAQEPVVTGTVVESDDPQVDVGARVVYEGGELAYPISTLQKGGRVLDEDIKPTLTLLLGTSGTEPVSLADGDVDVFVDALSPSPELLVFGGQNDVHPVVEQARTAGFRVTVTTARGGQSSRDRFPAADRVAVTHPTDLDDFVTDPARTYAVLMSHNFVDDRLALQSLLESTTAPYVGLLGPSERFEEMREAFADEGVQFTAEQLARVATPVGLDLGGGEPVQIALSIVTEALAVHNGRSGGRLSDRNGPIHLPEEASSR